MIIPLNILWKWLWDKYEHNPECTEKDFSKGVRVSAMVQQLVQDPAVNAPQNAFVDRVARVFMVHSIPLLFGGPSRHVVLDKTSSIAFLRRRAPVRAAGDAKKGKEAGKLPPAAIPPIPQSLQEKLLLAVRQEVTGRRSAQSTSAQSLVSLSTPSSGGADQGTKEPSEPKPGASAGTARPKTAAGAQGSAGETREGGVVAPQVGMKRSGSALASGREKRQCTDCATREDVMMLQHKLDQAYKEIDALKSAFHHIERGSRTQLMAMKSEVERLRATTTQMCRQMSTQSQRSASDAVSFTSPLSANAFGSFGRATTVVLEGVEKLPARRDANGATNRAPDPSKSTAKSTAESAKKSKRAPTKRKSTKAEQKKEESTNTAGPSTRKGVDEPAVAMDVEGAVSGSAGASSSSLPKQPQSQSVSENSIASSGKEAESSGTGEGGRQAQ